MLNINLVMFDAYSFIVTLSNIAPDPEKDSSAVQEFLENMEGAFRAHTPWAGSSEEELDSAGEVISLLSLNYSLTVTLLIITPSVPFYLSQASSFLN
jgi:hypothetical protein